MFREYWKIFAMIWTVKCTPILSLDCIDFANTYNLSPTYDTPSISYTAVQKQAIKHQNKFLLSLHMMVCRGVKSEESELKTKQASGSDVPVPQQGCPMRGDILSRCARFQLLVRCLPFSPRSILYESSLHTSYPIDFSFMIRAALLNMAKAEDQITISY